jgi:hypothetical protein
MKPLKNKFSEKQKKQRLKDIFSKTTAGGAGVATVIIVTATSFFIPQFEVESFSDRIYYEAIVEPLDIPEYPEGVDPNDPNVEIVYEEPELRIRLSSQFGDLYQDLDLFENEGVFEDLTPNTPYELTIQHYNGFSWVNLDQLSVRTRIENKASLIKIEERPDYDQLARSLTLTVMAEADLDTVKAMRLYVQTDTLEIYPLESGEQRINLTLNRVDQIGMWIEYDLETIVEEEVLNETKEMYRTRYQMLPYIPYAYQLNALLNDLELRVTGIEEATFYAILDDGKTKQRFNNIQQATLINTQSNAWKTLTLYANVSGYETPFELETINLNVFRDFVYVATLNDGKLILTIIDQDQRIQALDVIVNGQTFSLTPLEQDQVKVYEMELATPQFTVRLTLNNEIGSYYTLIQNGE